MSHCVPTGRVIKYPRKCALFCPPRGPPGTPLQGGSQGTPQNTPFPILTTNKRAQKGVPKRPSPGGPGGPRGGAGGARAPPGRGGKFPARAPGREGPRDPPRGGPWDPRFPRSKYQWQRTCRPPPPPGSGSRAGTASLFKLSGIWIRCALNAFGDLDPLRSQCIRGSGILRKLPTMLKHP